VLAPMYVHILARPHSPFALNRMCSILFPYLCFFSPGMPSLPYKEMLTDAPQTGMTIAPYQVNLYRLYQLFRKGGCNAMKQWGLLE
jgi:hypothetical protein